MPTHHSHNRRPSFNDDDDCNDGSRDCNCVCHDDNDMLCEFDEVDSRKCFDCGKFWDYCFDQVNPEKKFLSVIECCPYYRECYYVNVK